MNVIDQTTSSNFGSNSEFDSGFDEVRDLMNEMTKEDHGISGDVRISDHFNVNLNDECKIIGHNDLVIKDFNGKYGFYEVERGNYQRLHFDFDFGADDEVNEVNIEKIFDTIVAISEVVGEYEIHGYTNDETIFNII